VIRIFTTPRNRKSLAKFSPEDRRKFQKRLEEVAAAFGDAHRHGGLGLRKLGRRSFEIRVHLRWRIVLILDGGELVAFDIMDHNEVGRWLHGR
jgi:mRNA-degrading endonuclease RelE of RelBE toxin-antitoxin system